VRHVYQGAAGDRNPFAAGSVNNSSNSKKPPLKNFTNYIYSKHSPRVIVKIRRAVLFLVTRVPINVEGHNFFFQRFFCDAVKIT